MVFRNPEWIALLPVLAVAGWFWRSWQLWRPLRVALLLIITLILMRPQVNLQQDSMDLWVLLDRSESTEDRIDKGLPEWQKLLEGAKRSRDDRLRLVDFAVDPVPQDPNSPYTGSRKLTRTALAVQGILSLRDPDRASRILLFTDGYSTETMGGVADRLLRDNVPLDVRILSEPPGRDFRVRRLQTPLRAQTGEAFLIEVEITGPQDVDVPLTLWRDGVPLDTGNKPVRLEKGRGRARFTDRVSLSGAHKYEARIAMPDDSHAGNNHYESWVEITGGPRLLVVTNYRDDPILPVLRQQFTVEVIDTPSALRAGHLSGCRGLILNNVPAWELPADFLASLPFFIEAQGGGLLMTGGKKSFGAGGYFHSAVDALLPVSMELKKDQRKLAAAMAIVLDRSGSMAAPVGGGRIKMDLANEGSAKAIEFMGYQDSVVVFAVDSEAHEMVPMQQIGTEDNKQEMIDRTRRITSSGGGIFVYNGLKAGWKALRDTAYGTRHIILFADAADAEQPEDYVNLLAEVTKEGGTVSVIALGTEHDRDAAFLKDVASRGKGRIFFTDRAEDLPNVFTAETVAVARSAFITDPVATVPNGLWTEVSGKSLDWLTQVDGYNLSYRKDWASQGLVSKDEFGAPLVAWGQRGTGRTAAISFPLAGEFSQSVRAWRQYGDFLQTMARWLMGEDVPPGIGLRWDLAGTELAIDLMYSGEWEEKFAVAPPRLLVAAGERAESRRELTWQRMAPGHYRVVQDMDEGTLLRGVIQAGSHTLPFGPLAVGTSSEWAFDPARVDELRQVSAQSGGRELVDLTGAWVSPPLKELTDLRRWLLPLALVLLLAEALVTRMGWRMPKLALPIAVRDGKPKRARAGRKQKPVPAKPLVGDAPAVAKTPPAAEAAAPTTPPTGDDAERRRRRFARAKQK